MAKQQYIMVLDGKVVGHQLSAMKQSAEYFFMMRSGVSAKAFTYDEMSKMLFTAKPTAPSA